MASLVFAGGKPVRQIHKGMVAALWRRFASSTASVHSHRIDNNLELRSPDPILTEQAQRPLVILYGWLLVKSKHLDKFGDLYLDKGFDVLSIKVRPQQVLRPKIAQNLAQRVLNYIQYERHEKQPVLIHGFSVGGYLYSELLVKLKEAPDRYAGVTERLMGQVFDSPVDIQGIPYGIARVLTQNAVLQALIQSSLEAYLALFHSQVTQYYLRASAVFHENHLHLPSLLLYSKADPVGVPDKIEEVMQKWLAAGVPLYWKCWQDSIHVGHMHRYREEYIQVLMKFLEDIRLLAVSPDAAAASIPYKA